MTLLGLCAHVHEQRGAGALQPKRPQSTKLTLLGGGATRLGRDAQETGTSKNPPPTPPKNFWFGKWAPFCFGGVGLNTYMAPLRCPGTDPNLQGVQQNIPNEQQKNPVALSMLQNKKSSQTSSAVQKLAAKLQLSFATALKYYQATAQQCKVRQEQILDSIVQYVWQQERAGLMIGIAAVLHHSYDETKLRVRVELEPDVHHAGADGAKIFVLMTSWTILVKCRSDLQTEEWSYLMFSGCFSPYLRLADSTRAECVGQVINSGPKVITDTLWEIVPSIVRVAESDEAKSNLKGEEIVGVCKGDSRKWALHSNFALVMLCSQGSRNCRKDMEHRQANIAGRHESLVGFTIGRTAPTVDGVHVCNH